MTLRADNGYELTDDLIAKWAEDAEAGFPGYEWVPVDSQTLSHVNLLLIPALCRSVTMYGNKRSVGRRLKTHHRPTSFVER